MRSRYGSANASDAFGQFARIDVLLLEFALGLVEDERNFEGQVVLQVGADLLIRAFRVAGDAFEMLLDLGVVVDLEVVRRVDVPLEVVVPDPVLAVVRHERRLRESLFDGTTQQPDDHEGGATATTVPRVLRVRIFHLGCSSGRQQPGRAKRGDASVWLLVADVTVAKTVVATPVSPGAGMAGAGRPTHPRRARHVPGLAWRGTGRKCFSGRHARSEVSPPGNADPPRFWPFIK